MALQLSYTDPDTNALYPAAYVRIVNVNLTLTSGGDIDVAIYVNTAAATANYKPITPNGQPVKLTLSGPEADTLRQQGLALLYGILKQRPEYAGAIDV